MQSADVDRIGTVGVFTMSLRETNHGKLWPAGMNAARKTRSA